MKGASALSQFLAESRPWFEELRSPTEFEQRRAEIRRIVDGNFQFNRTDAKWLLEAWLVSQYARILGATQVQLNRIDPPDAFVVVENMVIPIEMTEVIEPGRKRGLEYRPEAPTVQMDPVEKWVERADKIPAALREGIERKLAKKYPVGTRLLVYLNIGEWGIRQQAIESEINSLLTIFSDGFSGIDVLWKRKLFGSDREVLIDIEASTDEEDWDDEELFHATVNQQSS